MKRQEILVDQERMYALTRDEGGQLYLEIVSGGFAMGNIVIPLSAAEVALYESQGKSYLDGLSLEVCKRPASYTSRRLGSQ